MIKFTKTTQLMAFTSVLALAACADQGTIESTEYEEQLASNETQLENVDDYTTDTYTTEDDSDSQYTEEPASSEEQFSYDTPLETAAIDSELIDSGENIIADGALSKDETLTLSQQKFLAADLNSDGALNEDEFVAMQVAMTKTLKTGMIADMNDSIASDSIDQALEATGIDGTVSSELINEGKEALWVADTAEVKEAATEQFAEIADGEKEITQEKVVAAIIASFESADIDGNDIIEGAEIEQFARLGQ